MTGIPPMTGSARMTGITPMTGSEFMTVTRGPIHSYEHSANLEAVPNYRKDSHG